MTSNLVGKGLAALLGDIAASAKEIEGGNQFVADNRILLNQIQPGRLQPRQLFDDEKLKDLIDSVKKNGVLQPIILRKIDADKYEIIAGERRWRASQAAGLDHIPAIIVDCTDSEALQIGLIENLQRDDLNPMEEAEAFLRLAQDHDKTQEEIALAVSKSRSYVANQMRLNNLSDYLKMLLRERKLSPGHARNLINDPNADETARRIIEEGLNVRQTEALRQGKAPSTMIREPSQEQMDASVLAEQIQAALGLRARIAISHSGGSLTLYFNSYDQLDQLVQKLS